VDSVRLDMAKWTVLD